MDFMKRLLPWRCAEEGGGGRGMSQNRLDWLKWARGKGGSLPAGGLSSKQSQKPHYQ